MSKAGIARRLQARQSSKVERLLLRNAGNGDNLLVPWEDDVMTLNSLANATTDRMAPVHRTIRAVPNLKSATNTASLYQTLQW
jgi:hypothetical protein